MKHPEHFPDFKGTTGTHRNLSYEEIFEHEIQSGTVHTTNSGAVSVDTGIYTGRSPRDKYIVEEEGSKDNIWWGNINQPTSDEVFQELHKKCVTYLSRKELYIFDGFTGARAETRMPIRVITENAWQHHFCKNMFIDPSPEELDNFTPEFTIINAGGLTNPDYERHGLNSETFIIFHLGRKIGIIGGTLYAGEMKKGMFSIMNYYRPLQGILTMHCSANQGKEKKDTALFFGLSGTGKTTLSTDSKRPIIGDDEHGWDDEGVWNLEGGCYAKVIALSQEDEPEIFGAIRRNALLENVTINEGEVDFACSRKTENTRVSYPISHIQNRVESGLGTHPENIIFLTADAFGVLPPVSRLTDKQASYHFLSGYTAKVAGTERGVSEPVATFSTCFGAAFITLNPTVYARLLAEKIRKHNVKAWLVNTGWAGGPYGIGSRMKIKLTRSIIDGIFSGELDHNDYTFDPVMNLSIPDHMGALNKSVLHPWLSWEDQKEYERTRNKLASMFRENFKKYESDEFPLSDFGPGIR